MFAVALRHKIKKNKMKKLVFTMAAILGFTILSAQSQLTSAFTSRLQEVLDSTCKKYNIKGASAAVLVPGAGTWTGIYGQSYSGQPVTKGMIFNIGSNTKTYVATTMLLLQEKGLVSLDDTIGKWIQNQPNISGKIKIRQLLNHTSGIYNFLENPAVNDSLLANPYKLWKPEQLLQFVLKPYFRPGYSWEYSNTNYIIAGIIIEQITGKTYNKAIRDLLFTPQGFNHTIFSPVDTSNDTIVHNWSVALGSTSQVDGNVLPGWSNNALFTMSCTAGEIMTAAGENAEFWHKLISGQIISDSSLNQMLTFIQIGTGPTGHPVGYGLGIFRYIDAINGRTFYEHGGTNLGFIAENMVDTTSGICFSLLTNQDSIDNDTLLLSVIGPMHKLTLTMQTTGIAQTTINRPAISIYPNPSTDVIHITVDNLQGVAKFQLYDISGKEVLQSDIHDGAHAIQVSQLKPGLYIASISSEQDGFIYSQKVNVVK